MALPSLGVGGVLRFLAWLVRRLEVVQFGLLDIVDKGADQFVEQRIVQMKPFVFEFIFELFQGVGTQVVTDVDGPSLKIGADVDSGVAAQGVRCLRNLAGWELREQDGPVLRKRCRQGRLGTRSFHDTSLGGCGYCFVASVCACLSLSGSPLR